MWHMLTMAKWLHCSIAAYNLHRKFTTKLIQSDLFISCHINISTGNGNREQFDYSLLGGFSRILDCCCCSSSSIYGFGYLLLFVYVAFLGVLLSLSIGSLIEKGKEQIHRKLDTIIWHTWNVQANVSMKCDECVTIRHVKKLKIRSTYNRAYRMKLSREKSVAHNANYNAIKIVASEFVTIIANICMDRENWTIGRKISLPLSFPRFHFSPNGVNVTHPSSVIKAPCFL